MLYYREIPLEKRIRHITPIFELCKEKTILDIGCAEGLIGLELIKNGSILLHGFDISEERIKKASKNNNKNILFRLCDLSYWDKYKNLLLPKYDIILFLGTYHHLNNKDFILNNLLELCNEHFLFRTSFANKEIPENIIKSKKFKQLTRFMWKKEI